MSRKKSKKQTKQMLKCLRSQGCVTTTYCRNTLSIMHPASIVNRMRKLGLPIGTNFYQQVDASGVPHRAGQYYLKVEKLTPEQWNIIDSVLAD